MRPKGPLFVERHYTTVSSHAHPPVHDFRPYLHQPADLEMCGGSLAIPVATTQRCCPATSHSSSSCSSRSIRSTYCTWMRAPSSTAHLNRHSHDHAPSLPTPPFSQLPKTTASVTFTQLRL